MPIVYNRDEKELRSCPSIAWVNGNGLAFRGSCGSLVIPPKDLLTLFPYTRLVAASSYNSSLSMLYHQINSSVLVEDTWDPINGLRVSEYITI